MKYYSKEKMEKYHCWYFDPDIRHVMDSDNEGKYLIMQKNNLTDSHRCARLNIYFKLIQIKIVIPADASS
jgi:hypothetical protein